MPAGLWSTCIDSPGWDTATACSVQSLRTGSRAGRFLHTATAFQGQADPDVEVVKCREPYHCISRVKKFGREHTGDVDPGAVKELDDPDTEDYEWGCPRDEQWVGDSYDKHEDDPDMCQEGDCKCVALVPNQGESKLVNGVEKITGEFAVQSEGDHVRTERLTLVPHYPQFQIPDRIMDPHTKPYIYLGHWRYRTRKEWLQDFVGIQGKQMQYFLDQLYKDLSVVWKARFEGKEEKDWVNASPKPGEPQPQGTAPTLTDEEAQDTVERIRSFQMLSKACSEHRDLVEKLAEDQQKQGFSVDGKKYGKPLNCFRDPENGACLQLNCYDHGDDYEFNDHITKLQNFLRTKWSDSAARILTPAAGGTEAAAKQSSIPGVAAIALLPSGPRLHTRSSRMASSKVRSFL